MCHTGILRIGKPIPADSTRLQTGYEKSGCFHTPIQKKRQGRRARRALMGSTDPARRGHHLRCQHSTRQRPQTFGQMHVAKQIVHSGWTEPVPFVGVNAVKSDRRWIPWRPHGLFGIGIGLQDQLACCPRICLQDRTKAWVRHICYDIIHDADCYVLNRPSLSAWYVGGLYAAPYLATEAIIALNSSLPRTLRLAYPQSPMARMRAPRSVER